MTAKSALEGFKSRCLEWGPECICICLTSSVLPPKANPSLSCVKKDPAYANEHSQLPQGISQFHPRPNEPSSASSSAINFIPETFETWGNYWEAETAPVKADRYDNVKKMNLKEGEQRRKKKKNWIPSPFSRSHGLILREAERLGLLGWEVKVCGIWSPFLSKLLSRQGQENYSLLVKVKVKPMLRLKPKKGLEINEEFLHQEVWLCG